MASAQAAIMVLQHSYRLMEQENNWIISVESSSQI